MTYRDEMRVCEKCGKKFVFTVEEQRAQDEMGLEITPPEYCPDCREDTGPQPGLHPGVVKWFSKEKGFGFIVRANGTEVFCHRSNVVGDLDEIAGEGASVWYEVRETDRGLEAYNVHLREE